MSEVSLCGVEVVWVGVVTWRGGRVGHRGVAVGLLRARRLVAGHGRGGAGEPVALQPVLRTGQRGQLRRELVAQLLLAVEQLAAADLRGPDVIPPELDDLLHGGGELCAERGVHIGQQAALHAGEHAVPRHAGHHVDVDRVLAHRSRGEAQHLGLARHRAVTHVHEHLLGTEERGLHAVLVEAGILADAPELLSA